MATRPPPQLEQVYIRDAGTFKALADPLRIQIMLELAVEPKAVKEVAASLKVRPTRLYYHFKILEQAGLIRVAGRRMVSGIEESRYEAIGESWQPAPEATTDIVKSGLVRSLLAMIRAELELAFLSAPDLAPGDPTGPVPVMNMTEFVMDESDVVEVQERLVALTEKFATNTRAATAREAGKRIYRIFFAGYLPPAELRDGPEEPAGKEPKDRPAPRARKAKRASRAT